MDATHLREALEYDRDSGVFTWKTGKRKGLVAGAIKGPNGYVQIQINGRIYLAHRLAWLYVYGRWPEHTLDHIDGNTMNNRVENLRDVVHRMNCQNVAHMRKNNSTGYTGVTRRGSKFIAQIGGIGYLGIYDTAEEAHAVYVNAKRQHHPGSLL